MAVISATGTRKRILDGTLPRSTFAGTPHPASLSSLPPRSDTARATPRPSRPCVSFCFESARVRCIYPRSVTQPGGTYTRYACTLHSSSCITIYITLRRRKRAPLGVARVYNAARRLGEGEKEGLGRVRDLVLAGTRSRTFSFRGQQFRIGAYAE